MTKLALPELPTEYTNLRACCVYAGVDERKTPRQHLGEPIYLEIINRAEESRKLLSRTPYLWSSTAIAFALFGIGMNAGWSGLLIGCLGMGGIASLGWALKLVRKIYEPTTQQLMMLAENNDQIEFLMEIEDLRRRLGSERKTSGVWAVEIMPTARGSKASSQTLPISFFRCDHGRLLLLKEEGFEAVRTRGRRPTGRILIRFSAAVSPITTITSQTLLQIENQPLFALQIAWLRDRAQDHSPAAARFRQMLDVIEGIYKYRSWPLDALATQLTADHVAKASLATVKKLNAGLPTPFSTYLTRIDLTEFPLKLGEPIGTGSEPSTNQ